MQLQSMVKEDIMLKLMKSRILTEMVYKEGAHNKYNVIRFFSSLNISVPFSFPTLALLEPSGNFRNKHEEWAFTEHVMDYIQTNITPNSVTFMDVEGRIGLLFSWESRNTIEFVHQSLNDHFTIPINIGVGEPSNRLENIHISYQKAVDALKNKFYKGIGNIFYFNEIEEYNDHSSYPIELEEDLFNSIKLADDDYDIHIAVENFYHSILKRGLLNTKNVCEMTIRLIVGLEKKVIADIGETNISVFVELNIMRVIYMETLQEIKEYVCNYLKMLNKILMYNNNGHSVITKALHYMERECNNATLESVAEEVYMTPTYLSALFRKNTGYTFISKLTQIRIEKAKTMLKGTPLKNYEVAEMVGYRDSRYFSQIFRKTVGITPTEYRELNKSAQ
ncbi:AraC family transcriptional regulator [Bacillus sp. FJAT-49711]|uniref:helix-turn-helix domain-containing protein n=1 Tax=Bacillus sp. FJAT-49711 TaxID=2833585 RepID=UPI001BC93D56|nr:helix-turn-helix domain-containing protein [Bacillus sp. FJAT-49711]MBS4219293.1 AraC family transcriptional regulator [Bacillus sp. FJAT-49711]